MVLHSACVRFVLHYMFRDLTWWSNVRDIPTQVNLSRQNLCPTRLFSGSLLYSTTVPSERAHSIASDERDVHPFAPSHFSGPISRIMSSLIATPVIRVKDTSTYWRFGQRRRNLRIPSSRIWHFLRERSWRLGINRSFLGIECSQELSPGA